MLNRADHQANDVQGPQAGKCSNIAVAGVGVPQSFDLSTLGFVAAPDGIAAEPLSNKGLLENFCFIQAIGADLLIVTGPTAASVTGGNAPVIATTGSNAAGCGRLILSGQFYEFRPNSLNQFLGVVSSAAGFMRIGPS